MSPTYTEESGALLGIIPKQSDNAIELLVPEIDASVLPGNVIMVKFTRGASNGMLIEGQIDNEPAWESFGRFPASPAEISIPLNQNSLPSSVKLRARYLDHNNPVGNWSDVVTVQTIP